MTKAIEMVEALLRDVSEIDCPTQTDLINSSTAEGCAAAHESLPKPRGYLHGRKNQAPWPPTGVSGPGLHAPRPLPKRPTGRFFIGTLLASICATSGWFVWSSFLDVSAYGVVKGDKLMIRSPWDGKISHVHVLEGQAVAKGAVLVTLDSKELSRELDRLNDELRVEQAKLESETIRVRHEHQSYSAEYLQLWGTLQKNREELSRMQGDIARIQSVKGVNVISGQEHDRIAFTESGQRELVEKLTAAVEELRKRSDVGSPFEMRSALPQLKPTLARIEYLEGQIRRTQDEIRDGELRSPVTGIVVRRSAAVGQTVSHLETILEVTDQDSLQIELFVQQGDVDGFVVGKELKVSIEPLSRAVTCTIIGSRKHFELAPESIRRYYTSQQTLMPLMLKLNDVDPDSPLSVGSIVKLKLLESLGWPSPIAAFDRGWKKNKSSSTP